MKYSQQMLCDVTGGSARGGSGGERGRLVVSPVQLEPSQTLLESSKQVRLKLSLTAEPLTTPLAFKANGSQTRQHQSQLAAGLDQYVATEEKNDLNSCVKLVRRVADYWNNNTTSKFCFWSRLRPCQGHRSRHENLPGLRS